MCCCLLAFDGVMIMMMDEIMEFGLFVGLLQLSVFCTGCFAGLSSVWYFGLRLFEWANNINCFMGVWSAIITAIFFS